MADESESKLKRCRIGKSFLQGNANDHVWPFSAIAELIDNAYDPDVMAHRINIDKCQLDDKVCLTIKDNGCGMDLDYLWKMLSFGFSEKDKHTDPNHLPIGQYGNGFNAGSMRLAKDALIFTYKRSNDSACIGFLSQTYHHAIGSEDVVLPMISYEDAFQQMRLNKPEGWTENLAAILEHSVYHQEEDLTDVLYDLRESGGGTKIVLFNLSRKGELSSSAQSEFSDDLELDFESDSTDIKLKCDYFGDENDNEMSDAPTYRYSLREYCGILFRVPRLKIFIRGKSVRTSFIEKSLSHTMVYDHNFEKEHSTKITIGLTCNRSMKSSDAKNYGLMLYNKKRLITAYQKIGLQLGESPSALGVVIVVELNHLTPIHTKQNFKREERPFINAMAVFQDKLKAYWETMEPLIKKRSHRKKRQPDLTMVQCDKCDKWRSLPELIDPNCLPEKWFCYMNSDTTQSSCSDPEELEDEDEVTISSTRDSKQSSIPAVENYTTLKKRKHLESDMNTLSNDPPGTKDRRLSRKGSGSIHEGQFNKEPASMDSDQPSTITEHGNIDMEHPSARKSLTKSFNTLPLSNDKSVQTEDWGPVSKYYHELETRMNMFKNDVAQLLHRIEPDIDLDAIGDDIESIVHRMLMVDLESYS